MASKSVVIFYCVTPQGIKLLMGKHSVFNDFMFIGGGRKKNETNSLCASREIFEETKSLFGPIPYIHNIIENQVFKCRPVVVDRYIQKKDNKQLHLKLKIHIFLTRIPYCYNINDLFRSRTFSEDCFNELSDIFWVNLSKLSTIYSNLFYEDLQFLKIIQEESDLSKLIGINQLKQTDTLNFSFKIQPKTIAT